MEKEDKGQEIIDALGYMWTHHPGWSFFARSSEDGKKVFMRMATSEFGAAFSVQFNIDEFFELQMSHQIASAINGLEKITGYQP